MCCVKWEGGKVIVLERGRIVGKDGCVVGRSGVGYSFAENVE